MEPTLKDLAESWEMLDKSMSKFWLNTPCLLYQFARAAMKKWHSWGGLNKRKLWFHSSEGWKSKVKGWKSKSNQQGWLLLKAVKEDLFQASFLL